MPESDQRGKDEVETPAAIRHMQRRARSRKGSNQRLRWRSRNSGRDRLLAVHRLAGNPVVPGARCSAEHSTARDKLGPDSDEMMA